MQMACALDQALLTPGDVVTWLSRRSQAKGARAERGHNPTKDLLESPEHYRPADQPECCQ